MKPLLVPDAANVILALQDEIRRSGESRYDHLPNVNYFWPRTTITLRH